MKNIEDGKGEARMKGKQRDNISANKLLFNLDRLAGDKRPITADIFLNNYCNNACPYCTYRRWEHEEGARYMSFDDFETYAERLIELGVKGMILTGGGEPTINPDFGKICLWLEEKGIPYGVNTNFNVFKAIRPQYLKVSLDGYDEDSYERIRGVRMYGKVVENIKRYAEWKKEAGVSTALGIQHVALSVDELIRFYEANEGLDVDYMVFRPIESTGGEFYEDDSKEKVREIIKAIESLREIDSRVVLNFKFNLLGVSTEACHANWAQIALNEKGEVIYCCHKPYEVVGHVMDSNILVKKAGYETNMKMCDVPCRMTDANLLVRKLEAGTSNPFFI